MTPPIGAARAGVFGGAGAIPDSVVNRLPLNEGTGTSVEALVGSTDGTLFNDGTWVNDSAYPNGTAPAFDPANSDYASWSPRSTTPITWMFGVDADSFDSGDTWIIGHNFSPLLTYNGSEWEFITEGGSDSVSVSDSSPTDLRYISIRFDSNDLALDVYQSDTTTKVGTDTTTNPDTAFDTSTNYFGNRTDGGGGGLDGQFVGPFDIYDIFLTDSKLASNISAVYG